MGSRGTARKFRNAARSSGTLAASPRGFVAAPQLKHATGPRAPALTPGARRGRRWLRGAGERGAPRGPAAGRGHLRVLLGEAVGRGAGGGEQW